MKKANKNLLLSLMIFLSFSLLITSVSDVQVALGAPKSGNISSGSSSSSKSSTSNSSNKNSSSSKSSSSSSKPKSNSSVSSGSFSSSTNKDKTNSSSSTSSSSSSSSSNKSSSSNNKSYKDEESLVFTLTSITRELRYFFGRNTAMKIFIIGLIAILIFAIIRRIKR